jgi:hypothetical protein
MLVAGRLSFRSASGRGGAVALSHRDARHARLRKKQKEPATAMLLLPRIAEATDRVDETTGSERWQKHMPPPAVLPLRQGRCGSAGRRRRR